METCKWIAVGIADGFITWLGAWLPHSTFSFATFHRYAGRHVSRVWPESSRQHRSIRIDNAVYRFIAENRIPRGSASLSISTVIAMVAVLPGMWIDHGLVLGACGVVIGATLLCGDIRLQRFLEARR
ncbi:MAG: hypothetical protein ABUL58_02500 [Steroidobacter sp.]